jgi:hypothetical protein
VVDDHVVLHRAARQWRPRQGELEERVIHSWAANERQTPQLFLLPTHTHTLTPCTQSSIQRFNGPLCCGPPTWMEARQPGSLENARRGCDSSLSYRLQFCAILRPCVFRHVISHTHTHPATKQPKNERLVFVHAPNNHFVVPPKKRRFLSSVFALCQISL